MYLNAHDLRLAYTDTGRGLPLLFVHGFPLNRSMWDQQVEALSPRYRILTLDLRGHGESDAPLWRYSVEEFADDVAALLDHLKLQQVVLVGLSMGGYVALACTRRFHHRLHGLILTDTRAQADTVEGRKGRFQLAQTAQTKGPAAVAEVMLPKLLAPETLQSNPPLVQRIRSMIESMPLSGIAGDLMAMADRPDSVSLLPSITCPTLVIVGEQDQATPVTDARLIAGGIPNARLSIIPKAGHLPNIEQPEEFNRVLEEFLSPLAR